MPETEEQQQKSHNQRDNGGALFKNDKGDNPKRPDYRGECIVGGDKYKISAWLRTSAGGKKYMSLAFNLEEAGVIEQVQEGNDDIPF